MGDTVKKNSVISDSNESQLNKEQSTTDSDKNILKSSEKETKDQSSSNDKLDDVDNSDKRSLRQRTPKKMTDDDDDDLQITGEVIKDNGAGSDIEMIEES